VYVETSIKNEATWYKVLEYFKYQIQYNPESIQRVVAQKTLYTILRNPNGNRYVLYLYWNGGQWNWNYNWLDNDWSAHNPSAVLATLFISLRQMAESFV
jgi:hypothetical protein